MAQPLTDEPRDLLLNRFNDLVIENGDFAFSTGIDAVVQSCRIVMQMFAGEWFLDLDAGIPYWQAILGFKPQVAIRAAQIAFSSELLRVPGVLAVTRLDVEYIGVTRNLEIRWSVRTKLGETPPDILALAITNSGVA